MITRRLTIFWTVKNILNGGGWCIYRREWWSLVVFIMHYVHGGKKQGEKRSIKMWHIATAKFSSHACFFTALSILQQLFFYFSALLAPSIYCSHTSSSARQWQLVVGSCHSFALSTGSPFFSPYPNKSCSSSMWIDMKGWIITTQNRRQLLICCSFNRASITCSGWFKKKYTYLARNSGQYII